MVGELTNGDSADSIAERFGSAPIAAMALPTKRGFLDPSLDETEVIAEATRPYPGRPSQMFGDQVIGELGGAAPSMTEAAARSQPGSAERRRPATQLDGWLTLPGVR